MKVLISEYMETQLWIHYHVWGSLLCVVTSALAALGSRRIHHADSKAGILLCFWFLF